jgi:hypothetical protein
LPNQMAPRQAIFNGGPAINEQENVEAVRRIYQLTNTGDLAEFLIW